MAPRPQVKPARHYRKRDLVWMWPYAKLRYGSRLYSYRWWDGQKVIFWYGGRATKDWHHESEAELIGSGYTVWTPTNMRYPDGV